MGFNSGFKGLMMYNSSQGIVWSAVHRPYSFLCTESIKIHLVLGMMTDVQIDTNRVVVWSHSYNGCEVRKKVFFSYLVNTTEY